MEEPNERRTRGACVPKWKGKQVCLFDSTGKCVSENSSEFLKLVASEVKDPRHIPLKQDWRRDPANDKELMWERIKVKIFVLYFYFSRVKVYIFVLDLVFFKVYIPNTNMLFFVNIG